MAVLGTAAAMITTGSRVYAAETPVSLEARREMDSPEVNLVVRADPGQPVGLESSQNLRDWTRLGVAVVPDGAFEMEIGIFSPEHSFFRAVATTHCDTGEIGETLRIDTAFPAIQLADDSTYSLPVWLNRPPAGPLSVTAALSAVHPELRLSGGTRLEFTPQNWNTPQTLELAAALLEPGREIEAELWLSAEGTSGTRVTVSVVSNQSGEVFAGPFPSWANARSDFGAVGDGVADDTAPLQAALDSLRPNNGRPVLFLPNGRYRITQTLAVRRQAHAESKDIQIVGEDPAGTHLIWDGPAGGTMILYEAWYSKMSRLTLDGAGQARTGLAHGPMFSTHNEFSDLVFTGLINGIEAGAQGALGNAETVVERCRFIRCSGTAVSIQNANSLDWFIRRSHFQNCGRGVSNLAGAGNFHVYDSLFENSTVADMSIGNTGFFSMRNNISRGAKAFFTAEPIASTGLVTLQGNRVYAPAGLPIKVGNLGPLLLLDNYFEDYQGRVAEVEPSAGFVAVGNRYTSPQPVSASSSGLRVDELFLCRKAAPAVPRIPAAPRRATGPVFEVRAGATAAAVQAAIDEAAQVCGQRPIVHLPASVYPLDRTVRVPAGCDLMIVGDGAKTALRWAGGEEGPVLLLAGPSRATLRDLKVFGTFNSILSGGIAVQDCDQPGSRVEFNQVSLLRARDSGLLVDGLAHTRVLLENFYHAENRRSLDVKGPGGNGRHPGFTAIFGGASANNRVSYDVREAGQLLVRDVWYESGPDFFPFLTLTNSGRFTLHGANVAPRLAAGAVPSVQISDFQGAVSLIGTRLFYPHNRWTISGDARQTRVLFLASLAQNLPEFDPETEILSVQQSFQIVGENKFSSMETSGPDSSGYLREMLRQTRRHQPELAPRLPPGVTDLHLHRIFVEGGTTAILLTR